MERKITFIKFSYCRTRWHVTFRFFIILSINSFVKCLEEQTAEQDLINRNITDSTANLIKYSDIVDNRSMADKLRTVIIEFTANLSSRVKIDKGLPSLSRFKDGTLESESSSQEITPDIYYVFYYNAAEREYYQQTWTYTIFAIISIPFSLANVIIYLLILDKLNHHGLAILCFATSQLIASCLFIGIQPTDGADLQRLFKNGIWPCYLIAVLGHFFYTSSYMWLTILNFNLWTTFKTVQVSKREGKEWKKFGIYCVFGWGVPLAVIIVSTTLDNVYRNRWSNVPVPAYAKNVCFMSTDARGYYLYLPICIIMIFNVALTCLTMKIFWAARNQIVLSLTVNNNPKKYPAKLFAKVFVVMGGVFLSNYISWYYSQFKKTPWGVVILECSMCLSPIFYFHLFCLNKKVVTQLEQKYPLLSGCLRPIKKFLRIETESSIRKLWMSPEV